MKQNELQELENFAKSFLKNIAMVPSIAAEKIKEDLANNSVTQQKALKDIEEIWAKKTFDPVLDTKEGKFWIKKTFIPTLNIKEGEFVFHIEMELPGIKKEDIHIEIKDSKLIISGEKKHERKSEGDSYTRIESSFGKFQREFELSNVDKENITASMNDGILEIVLPKVEKAEKKIEIK